MSSIKVTSQLLERYHSGHCSANERRLVEEWLTDPDEEIIESHKEEEEREIETKLWNAIITSTGIQILSQKRNRVLRFYKYGIAASIILFISVLTSVYFSSENKKNGTFVSLDNLRGHYALAKNVNGLVLTALPKANIRAVFDAENDSANIRFCEAMLVRNESLRDINLQFGSDCISDGAAKQRVFVCKKGVTYVAVRLNREQAEIIVVDQRYLEDILPLNVAMKINHEINSITI